MGSRCRLEGNGEYEINFVKTFGLALPVLALTIRFGQNCHPPAIGPKPPERWCNGARSAGYFRSSRTTSGSSIRVDGFGSSGSLASAGSNTRSSIGTTL